MAFALGVAGVLSASNKASSTTVGGQYTAVPAGSLVLALIAKDNFAAASGDNDEVTQIVDAQGNTWTKAIEHTNAGAAGDAITVSFWYSVLTTAMVLSDTMTATFADAIVAKALRVISFTIEAGNDVEVVGTQADEGDATDPGALTISGLEASVEHLFVRALALEGVNGITPTAGWTGISSASTSGGAADTNARLIGEWLISTATGATSDPAVGGTDPDYASVLVAFKEAAAAGEGSFPALRSKAPRAYQPY